VRFSIPAAGRTTISSSVLSQQLTQSASQQQLNSITIGQPPRQLLSGQLSSPPPQPVLKAPTPGMPSSVGSASYPTAATPNQSFGAPMSVKTELSQILGSDSMPELKTEFTGCNAEEDIKPDITAMSITQQSDQGSVDDASSNMATDLEDCSTASSSSLLGPPLEVKQDPSSGQPSNPVKPVAKKGKLNLLGVLICETLIKARLDYIDTNILSAILYEYR
jgi:hypothetical protein